jgi:predicted HD superfamily hydrolase involved in NAD metabolism
MAWAHQLALPPAQQHAVAWASLLHDNAKQWPANDLHTFLTQHNHPWHPTDAQWPAVWHAWAGAFVAQHTWGIEDPACLNAIAWHTTGHPTMGVVEAIVYVADKTEPLTRDPALLARWQAQVAVIPNNTHTPLTRLNHWLRVLLADSIQYLVAHQRAVHPHTVAAWNAALLYTIPHQEISPHVTQSLLTTPPLTTTQQEDNPFDTLQPV